MEFSEQQSHLKSSNDPNTLVNYPADNGRRCKSVTTMHVRYSNELHLKPRAPTGFFFPGWAMRGLKDWSP